MLLKKRKRLGEILRNYDFMILFFTLLCARPPMKELKKVPYISIQGYRDRKTDIVKASFIFFFSAKVILTFRYEKTGR